MCLDDSMMPRGFKWEIEMVLGVNLAYIWRDERVPLYLFKASVRTDQNCTSLI